MLYYQQLWIQFFVYGNPVSEQDYLQIGSMALVHLCQARQLERYVENAGARVQKSVTFFLVAHVSDERVEIWWNSFMIRPCKKEHIRGPKEIIGRLRKPQIAKCYVIICDFGTPEQ